jgi:predicted nucleic acid-binding protein
VISRARHHNVLLDTGPLVAIRTVRDSEHERCVKVFKDIELPLLTCWPVLTEAAWMLRQRPEAVAKLYRGVADGVFRILPLADDDLREIERLHVRYANLTPQLADLSLLHLAEREGLDTVFTIDRRDFTVFRLKGRKRLRLLPND